METVTHERLPADLYERRKKRERRLIAIAMALGITLLGAAIGLRVYAGNYMPIVHAGSSHTHPCLDPVTNDLSLVICRSASEIEWGWTIRNDGPFAITIEDIDAWGSNFRGRRLQVLQLPQPGGVGMGIDPSDAEPFEPFRLEAGTVHLIMLRGVLARPTSCGIPQGSLEIAYRVGPLNLTTYHDGPEQVVIRCGRPPTASELADKLDARNGT